MSWGHAVSRDLVHWRELPVALPEENGIMIFTGSTVVDQHNTSGFCPAAKPCLVAIYTGHTLQRPDPARRSRRRTSPTATIAAAPGPSTLRIRSSNLHMSDFRDPKVFVVRTRASDG